MAIDLLLVAMVGAILWSDGGTSDRDAADADDDASHAVVHEAPTSTDAAHALATAAQVMAAAASAAANASSRSAAGTADEVEVAVLSKLPQGDLVREVRSLRRQIAEARRPLAWYERSWHWLHGIVAGYGGSLVYFTLVTTFWRGRTVGKRLLGLRVVEITGKPMSLRLAFTRYGGYVAGLVTGGIGLVQLLWDPNRQGLQDKVAHTVVVDERAERAAPLPPASAGS